MRPSVVIYHKTCPSKDGFASAFAAWLKLRDTADYVPLDPHERPPVVQDQDVYILDLSFDEDTLHRMAGQAKSITLLDHHKTARNRLSHVKLTCCSKLHFDLEESGATLAWQHFHPDEPMPWLFEAIKDRDRWTWLDDRSKPFLSWLDAQPLNFEHWETLLKSVDGNLERYVELGAFLSQRVTVACEDITKLACPVQIDGERGLMVNDAGVFRSEVGMMLAERCGTFALIWRVAPGGVILCSLRSVKGFDVESLAVRFGGAGHDTAASFTLDISMLPTVAAGQLFSNRHTRA